MKTSSYYFNLPEELIAQFPSDRRENSRLLVLDSDTGNISHNLISDLPRLIPENTTMVLNNSRVRKARIFGDTLSGGRVEFLLVEKLSGRKWKAVVSKSKRQKPGRQYTFEGGITAVITDSDGAEKVVEFSRKIDDLYLEKYGHIPLPPYIKRDDAAEDSERYQTVFSRKTGSIAAPTAGLHFTDSMIGELNQKGIRTAFVTLHVGLGTFLPVRTEDIEDHHMHTEEYEVPEETADIVSKSRSAGKKILAVGTTSIRTLEAAWSGNRLTAGRGKTDLFIYPGYKFRAADMVLTNFHTPESSLLILVSAFAGKDKIDKAYAEAIKERYRFYSYGDAMLIR